MKQSLRFADLHCHPNLKTYGHSYDTCILNKKCNVWYRKPPGFTTRLLSVLAGITRFSQADFTTLGMGGSKIILASLYPFEKGFFNNAAGNGALSAFLSDFITGIGYRRVRNLQEHTDYFEDLEKEYRFFINSNRTGRIGDRNYSWKPASEWEEVKQSLEAENEIAVILSIEGAHVFNTGLDEFGRAANEKEIIQNIRKVKGWEFPPLFITFAHNFNNDLCGHARSLEPIKLFVDQSRNVDTGFTPLGRTVLKELLSAENGRKVYIDIKHMSLASRKEYFAILKSEYGDNIPPTIVSHGAVNGQSWSNPGFRAENSVFYPSDINFFDEEITYIGKSGGLFAIQFDTRRIAKKHLVKKSLKSIFGYDDSEKSARLIWFQLQHIAEVLDHSAIFGWGTACIGSDYDGTIDPLPGIWTAEYFPALNEHLMRLASEYLNGQHLLTCRENREISPEEIVQRFFIRNTEEFLRRFL